MRPESYTLYFIPEPENNKCKRTFSCDLLEEQTLQLSCSASGKELPLNCMYSIIIESVNNAGRTNSTGIILLSKLSDTL